MFYFLNLYSYREYSRKKTNVFNSFNSLNSFNSKKLSEAKLEIYFFTKNKRLYAYENSGFFAVGLCGSGRVG